MSATAIINNTISEELQSVSDWWVPKFHVLQKQHGTINEMVLLREAQRERDKESCVHVNAYFSWLTSQAGNNNGNGTPSSSYTAQREYIGPIEKVVAQIAKEKNIPETKVSEQDVRDWAEKHGAPRKTRDFPHHIDAARKSNRYN